MRRWAIAMNTARVTAILVALAALSACAAMPSPRVTTPVPANLFYAGEPAVITVRGAQAGAHWRITDAWGQERLAGRIAAPVARLDVAELPPGYYELTGSAPPLDTPTSFAIMARPTPPSADAAFGVQTHFAQGWSVDMVEVLRRLGIAHVRDELYWNRMEWAPGRIAAPLEYLRYMHALRRADITPLIILTYAHPNHDNGDTPHTDAGRAAFARYAERVSQQFGAQTPALEVWNEFNGTFCQGPACADRPASYTALLRTTTRALRAADHWDGTIVGGAVVHAPLPYLAQLFAQGALAHMDALAIHPYHANPDTIIADIQALRAQMAMAGGVKPIWITEWGRQASNEEGRFAVARFLAQMSITYAALEIERAYWYLLRDYNEFTGFGLVRSPSSDRGRYSPAPAAPAFVAAARHLEGATPVCRLDLDPRTHAQVFQRRDGRQLIAAWSQEGEAVLRLTARTDAEPGAAITAADLFAAPIALDEEPIITLGADPIYITGPVARIEETRAERLVTDSLLDFTLTDAHRDGDGAKPGWTYGPATKEDGAGVFELRPAHVYQSEWRTALASVHADVFALSRAQQHPARGASPWAVRRWTAPASVEGELRAIIRHGGRGDGVDAIIAVNGEVVWRSPIPTEKGETEQRPRIPLNLRPGDRVDIAIGPGAHGDPDYDATSVRVRIVTPADHAPSLAVCAAPGGTQTAQ